MASTRMLAYPTEAPAGRISVNGRKSTKRLHAYMNLHLGFGFDSKPWNAEHGPAELRFTASKRLSALCPN